MTSACPKTMLFFSQAAPAALLAPVGAEEKDAGNVGGQAARAVAASAALLRAQLRPSALLRRLCRGAVCRRLVTALVDLCSVGCAAARGRNMQLDCTCARG